MVDINKQVLEELKEIRKELKIIKETIPDKEMFLSVEEEKLLEESYVNEKKCYLCFRKLQRYNHYYYVRSRFCLWLYLFLFVRLNRLDRLWIGLKLMVWMTRMRLVMLDLWFHILLCMNCNLILIMNRILNRCMI